jgi:hypothetical protein
VLRLDKRKLRQLALGPSPPGARTIRVGNRASARLLADRRDFDIADSPPTQFVGDDDSTEFYFVVTPLRAGARNLKLLLGITVRTSAQSESIRERLVADRQIRVAHDPIYEVKQLAPAWVPIMAIVFPAALHRLHRMVPLALNQAVASPGNASQMLPF